MRIKVLSRNREEFTRERPTDLVRVHRNLNPLLHPFERAREYTRAVNAVKLDKVFAKPFIAALSGHVDSVFTIAKNPKSLNTILSGSCDGEVRVWNLANKTTIYSLRAHRGFVRGIAVCPDGNAFLTCGDDKTIKHWNLAVPEGVHTQQDHYQDLGAGILRAEMDEALALKTQRETPISTHITKYTLTGIDHQPGFTGLTTLFATSGASVVELWDRHRSEPVSTLEWGADTINTVRFNLVESNILASTATDRSIVLYDVRQGGSPLRKVILEMKSNAVAWNPMEAFNFTVANEDHNLYTFDMRKLDRALKVHTDHVSAVLDVDYSPTGREFVSGSYDRTLRIFPIDSGRSREVYHTKRMQRIFCVRFSQDARFVLSGSDDTNIRIWKATAAQPLGVLANRQRDKLNYYAKLKQRFQHLPLIKRISRHRHLPKAVYKATKLKRIMKEAQQRKLRNVAKYSKPEEATFQNERTKHIVAQQE